MIQGKRVAIPVNSPVVYSSRKDGNPGSVSGCCADQLASQIVNKVKETYKDSTEFSLQQAWQGT